MNDEDVQTRIVDPKGHLAKLLKSISDDGQLIEELYLSTLSRFPKPDEREKVENYVKSSASRDAAMQDVLWSLINVREFIFVR